MRITLSKKYGVNPSLGVCPICSEDNGEVLLLGTSLGRDVEAPHRTVRPLEPCTKCKEKYLVVGVMLLEGTRDAKGNPTTTGNLIVLTNEAFIRLFNMEPPRKKIALVEPELFARLQEPDDKNREA